jgi:ABC-2 type transport system permease protein
MYGGIYMNKIEQDVPIAFVDQDNSSLSRAFLRSVDAHQNIKLDKCLFDASQAKRELSLEKYKGVLIVPKDFSKNIKAGKKTNVDLIASPGRLLILSDIGIPISQIASSFGAKITASTLSAKGVPVFENLSILQPVKIDFHYMSNSYLTYGDLVLPGLMVIIISQLTIIGSAAASAKEWGMNKYRDMFAVSDNYFSIVAGKVLANLALFYFFSLIIMACIVPFYHIKFNENLANIFLAGTLGITASALFGLFIGTFFRHRITVFVVLGFTTYPFFMLSGFAWPWDQIPYYMQWAAKILPLTPFLQSMMSITQMNNDFSYLHPQVWNFAILIVLYFMLTVARLYRLNHYEERKTKLGRYISSMPR